MAEFLSFCTQVFVHKTCFLSFIVYLKQRSFVVVQEIMLQFFHQLRLSIVQALLLNPVTN